MTTKAKLPLTQRLRSQVTITRATETKDAKGGYQTAWLTIAEEWAEVLGLDGRETMLAQALQGVSSYRVTIRWRNDLLASDQVTLDDGTRLNVRSISDPTGLRSELQILADTGSAQAE